MVTCCGTVDDTGYAQLRKTCVNFHTAYLDKVEALIDILKEMEPQGSNPAESARVDTLISELINFRASWCLFLRRPEGTPSPPSFLR